MGALHDSLVEWTVLALGASVAAALLLRARMFHRWPGFWLPCVALAAIVANAGIAVTAAAAAARSEAAAAWNLMEPAMAGAAGRGVAIGLAVVVVGVLAAVLAMSVARAGLFRGWRNATARGDSRDGAPIVSLRGVGSGSDASGGAADAVSGATGNVAGDGAGGDDDVCCCCGYESLHGAGGAADREATPPRRRARGVTMTRLGGA